MIDEVAADKFSSAKDTITKRFLDAYAGCRTGDHPDEFSTTPLLPPFGSPKDSRQFIITIADKMEDHKLHFTFRLFRHKPEGERERFIRPSQIPLNEEITSFFASEWRESFGFFKELNPFCGESRLFGVEVTSDEHVWATLNFNYREFAKLLTSSQVGARRFICGVFKNHSSATFKDVKAARNIFSSPVESIPQEASLVSSLTSAVRTRFEYPLENLFKPFFETFKDIKIKDLTEYCRSVSNFIIPANRNTLVRSPFQIDYGTMNDVTDNLDLNSDLTLEAIYGRILNDGFTACNSGFDGLNCPSLSWNVPQLSFLKRVVKIDDIYVCISGVHKYGSQDSEDAKYLMEYGKDQPFMVIRVTITDPNYKYGTAPHYNDEFRILFIQEKN